MTRCRPALIVTMLFLLPASAIAKPPLKEEMRGAKFGMTPAQVPGGVVKKHDYDGTAFYERKRPGKITYHGLPMEHENFGFQAGKLTAVELWTAKLGPTFKFACDDLPPTFKSMQAAIEKNFEFVDRFDTLLNMPGTHPGDEALQPLCNKMKADDCMQYNYVIDPSDDPSDREVRASIVTVQWHRERKREEFTPEEIAKIRAIAANPKKAAETGMTVDLDVYECQHRIQFTQGDSRKQIDDREKARKELFDSLLHK